METGGGRMISSDSKMRTNTPLSNTCTPKLYQSHFFLSSINTTLPKIAIVSSSVHAGRSASAMNVTW